MHSREGANPGTHLNREYEWENATGRLSLIGASAFGRMRHSYDKIGNPVSITAGKLSAKR